jgi:glycine/D-amino acid oxidase-like deaminating enzyme
MQHVLIVGGGIAGISLAHALAKQGDGFTLIDDGKNACSSVAAGIVNPFSFRRTLLTWNATPFFDEAYAFYKNLEEITCGRFCFDIQIKRVFSSKEEAVLWGERWQDPIFRKFMFPLTQDDEKSGPFGSGRVKGFWVNAKQFIQKNHDFFDQQKTLRKEAFSLEEFDPVNNKYKGNTYSAVVFALGYRNKEVPFFKKIPVQSTKGEVLTIRWDNKDEETSIHRKVYALPVGSGLFKLGATYAWGDESVEITPKATEELLDKFSLLTNDPVEVVFQEAGIRPTSPDRRPFIGRHQDFPGLYMFNGLGTKGYLTAPPLAKRFADYFVNTSEEDPQTNPYRFLQS